MSMVGAVGAARQIQRGVPNWRAAAASAGGNPEAAASASAAHAPDSVALPTPAMPPPPFTSPSKLPPPSEGAVVGRARPRGRHRSCIADEAAMADAEEGGDGVLVAALRRRHQRRHPLGIGGVEQLGCCGEQLRDHLGVAARRRQHQRREPLLTELHRERLRFVEHVRMKEGLRALWRRRHE